MSNIKMFENVLKINSEYVALIKTNASADEQITALNKCDEAMKQICELGLSREYGEYCKTIQF